MKKFYFTEKMNNKKYNNAEITIYQLFKNNLKYIGSVYYSTASTRGAESEVLHYVCKMGLVPKKVLELSKSDWSDAGYYCAAIEDKYCLIKRIY